MEMETRLVLKRSPQGEVVATLPMLLPVGATVADVLARAGFGGLDGRSAWVNGREVDAEGKVGAQLTVTLFLGPDDPRPRSDGSRAGAPSPAAMISLTGIPRMGSVDARKSAPRTIPGQLEDMSADRSRPGRAAEPRSRG
jgi:hypothetical protein